MALSLEEGSHPAIRRITILTLQLGVAQLQGQTAVPVPVERNRLGDGRKLITGIHPNPMLALLALVEEIPKGILSYHCSGPARVSGICRTRSPHKTYPCESYHRLPVVGRTWLFDAGEPQAVRSEKQPSRPQPTVSAHHRALAFGYRRNL